MKKILGLAILALMLVGLVIGGTFAYFSDTETVGPNTFSAGTIDLVANAITQPIETDLTDLKPCMTGYVEISISNNGTNPFDVWKLVDNVTTTGGITTEPELAEDPGNTVNDIDSVIRYSMALDKNVGSYTDNLTEAEGFTISTGAHGLTTTAMKGQWMYLGVIPPNTTWKVKQGYHMDASVTNWAQGDTMSFNIWFYAQQSEGTPKAPPPGTQLTGHAR